MFRQGQQARLASHVAVRAPAALLVLCALFPVPASALDATTAPTAALSLERAFADPPLEGRAPTNVQLSPGGRFVTFLKPNENDSEVLDLWGAALPDGKPRLLVATADLLGGRDPKLTEQERMALERKRITKRGITEYVWCGADAQSLLFPLSGDLYVAQLVDGGAPQVTRLTNDEDIPELVPVCSEDGRKMAFVKKGNVHVLDVVFGKLARPAKQLTRGASPTRTFGLAEFIAEEEMDRHEGMWWSPDGKRLLVFEVEEASVGVKVRPQIFADRTELVEQRYPAAGEKNAVVTAWLFDVTTSKGTRLQTPTADGYLPRGGFFPDGHAWVQWQSRDQRRLVLFESNPQGVLRQVLEENDAAWVELHDDLATLPDGRLLWSSEASGRRQLVVVDRRNGARTPLTHEPEAVEHVLAVSAERGVVFFSGYRDRGRQLHVLSVPLAGGPSTAVAAETGWHTASFDDAGRFFVDKRSDFGRPWRTAVRDGSGKELLVLDENPAAELLSFARSSPQWLDLKADDGTVLNGVLLAPVGLAKGKKAPVITFVYGGPGAITVRRAWLRQDPVFTHWTQRGFGVFLLDTRGMAGRDRAFGHAHHRAFGDVEVRDLFAAVAQLAAQTPWVDAQKIGVFGWSYGGFLAARAVLDDKSPFAAAVAVAPVTTWSLYDTHYTERYLGLPVENGVPSPAYARADLVTRAAQLSRPLLLVHGTADDNVLFEHTLRLTDALQREGRLFDLMVYPGKAHGISGRAAQLHVYKSITTFLEEKLR